MISLTTVLVLILVIVALVLIYKYIIPTLPEPINWITSLIILPFLLFWLYSISTGHAFVLR